MNFFSKLSEIRNVDLIHYPYFDLFKETLEISDIPTAVTIHDTTPLIFPDTYPPGIRGRQAFDKQKKALKNVQAIITDSEASKKDIVKYLEISSSKVFSIHLAPAGHFKKIIDKKLLLKIKEKYSLPEKFALFVGDVNYNKNILSIIKATKEVEMPLVICGKQAVDIEDSINSTRIISGPRDLIRFMMGRPHPEVAHFKNI